MNAPHVQLNDDGSVSLRVSAEDARILSGYDQVAVLCWQDRFRPKLFVASMEAACKSEAVA